MVQIVAARPKRYVASMNTVFQDGKPHETFEVTLATLETPNITPQKIISPDGVAATSWDYAPATSATAMPKEIAVTEIPNDYPGRDQYDKATAYGSAAKNVPVGAIEVGDVFTLTTAVNCTGFDEGCKLTLGTDDIVAIDNSPDAFTALGHCFKLVQAISATEIVVKYEGLAMFDLVP